jgi:predicted acyltransferase
MKHYKLIKIFLMIVINTIIVLGGTHAEHMQGAKKEAAIGSEKDVFPDFLFFAGYLYQ